MSQDNEVLRIVTYPGSVLRRAADRIEDIDDELRELAASMARTMYANMGVGLAAPQVGVAKKILIINPTGEPADERILVNPVITSHRGDMEGVEGCLSVPGVSGDVRRYSHITLHAWDLDGNELDITATDFVARVLQHEIDHVEGMLLIDRMTPESRMNAREALRLLEEEAASLPGDPGAAK